ncbi:MAG TPA: serine hydrolase [Symbiobacteriaceae bacterium]|nr:serine hydrolase [Symbiobacteriaceae bacterium]
MIPDDYPVPAARAARADLQRALRELLPANVAVYVEDLHAGLALYLPGDGAYPAGGLEHLPVSLCAFARAADGQFDLDTQVTYQLADRVGGEGAVQASPPGTSFSVRELCRHALADRDRTACRMLRRALGDQTVIAWLESIGVGNAGLDEATPTAYATCLKYVLALADHQPVLGGALLEWLRKGGGTRCTAAGLPASVPVAHVATGSGDAGIAFVPQAPYVICAMSGAGTADTSLFARIGSAVYQGLRPLAGKFAAVCLGADQVPLRLPAAFMSDELMVSADDLARALGAESRWDPATQQISLLLGGRQAALIMGQNRLSTIGQEVTLAVAAFRFEHEAIVPLRPVAEALGVSVVWDPDRCRAILTP